MRDLVIQIYESEVKTMPLTISDAEDKLQDLIALKDWADGFEDSIKDHFAKEAHTNFYKIRGNLNTQIFELKDKINQAKQNHKID